ncbi:MAG TPA: SUMF1/EgtB/PvdO family nonheme iron enzyme [Blastocatellia bacterium]|nr:SUMF1/EgtB/PvdO family nonheme iron enzyme [Blastocatellia bacterium]
MAHGFDAREMALRMREARSRTRELFDTVISESDLRRPPSEGFRPLLWHLGHIGAFESYWLAQQVKGRPPLSDRYDAIFDPIKTPREDSSNLPPIPEIESYLGRVREESLACLAGADPDSPSPLLRGGYVFYMVLEHEYQHQETICYLLQMLSPELKRRPAGGRRGPAGDVEPVHEVGMIHVERGPFEMGSYGYPFAYDNEQPPRRVEVGDFLIDRYPVTNGEYARFIDEGGYSDRSLWSDEGWAWKEEAGAGHPLYWAKAEGGGWRVREMFEDQPLRAGLPVTGVSWHEAEAYARSVGKRLPTEAEWEKAATWDPRAERKRRFSWGDEPPRAELANFDNHHWEPTPVSAFPEGRSAYDCFDMSGNVWEWTSSVFAAYPGFKAFPYPEYSELWFDGDHRVLKGGSWTTRAPLLRGSFRNFFRPRFRAAFAGFRCAL